MSANKRQRVEIAGSSSSDGKLDALLKWIAKYDVSIECLNIQQSQYGLTVFAARDISAKEIFAAIPHELLLTAEKAWATELGAAVKSCSQSCSNEMMLWLSMAAGRRRDAKHFWAPYLQSLPETASIPTTWPASFLAEQLAGTNLLALALAERQQISREFEPLAQ